ncbi:MAG: DNA phosphorothioation-associated protein 4 [Krumholzibacteria bacterium]|nr:DNA phosphorothioation-associated protein 4 [Candidatus Krumholzibacteria bacterium]
MEKRISPPREYEELLDELVAEGGAGNGRAVFRTKQKAMMFAAALGAARGRRTPLKAKGTQIRFDIFQNAMDDGFVRAVGAAASCDLTVLGPDRQEELATIFEEYACTGLEEMSDIFRTGTGSRLEIVVDLIMKTRLAPQEGDDVDEELLRDLMG